MVRKGTLGAKKLIEDCQHSVDCDEEIEAEDKKTTKGTEMTGTINADWLVA